MWRLLGIVLLVVVPVAWGLLADRLFAALRRRRRRADEGGAGDG